jgi:hypothetical protein
MNVGERTGGHLAARVSQQRGTDTEICRLTVESCAVFAIGIVVGAVEPLVGVAALTRVGLADIGLVTGRGAT